MNANTVQQLKVRSAKDPGRSHVVPLPASDIDACIQFSKLRCVLCILSIILVCSDIPRTGLGTKRLSDIIPVTEPSSGIFFGPHSFPIATIIKAIEPETTNASSKFVGSCGDTAINHINIWAHKKSTLSIAMRGLVKMLRIEASWPRCLLYLEPCKSENVDLLSTFEMLDSVVSAVHTQLFSKQRVDTTSRPFVFLTVNRWIDRMHHYVLMLVGWARQQSRFNTVHYFVVSRDSSFNVCDYRVPRTNRPSICDFEIPWMCYPPSNRTTPSSLTPIPLWKHFQIRLAQLQHQHPKLQFDVTLFSSLSQRSNADDPALLRWMFYQVGQSDITIVIRGRNCLNVNGPTVSESNCETVLIDEFRHERTTLVTDLDQWYLTVAVLRCFGQGFMYLRILALWIGCYKARSSEFNMAPIKYPQKIMRAWVTLFKIPGQVIVYSCWPPIFAYALAHLIDGAAIHMRAETFGTAVNGKYSFSLFVNLEAAAIQMRNIWWIAVLAKLLTWIQTRVFPSKWHRKYGFLCIRGTWMGCISAITILAPLQTIQHRDSRIINVQRLSSNAGLPYAHLALRSEYRSDGGAALDAKTIVEASFLIIVLIAVAKSMIWFGCRYCRDRRAPEFKASMVVCRSQYLPYSVGALFDSARMSLYWDVQCIQSEEIIDRYTVTPLVELPAKAMAYKMESFRSLASTCTTYLRSKNYWGRSSAEGCPDYDSIYDVSSRSKKISSVVRLINLAMLTDPIVLFRLYGIGQRLYLHCAIEDDANEHSEPSGKIATLVLLPCSPSQIVDEMGTDSHYGLWDFVDSTSVPWTLLLQCG